MYDAAAALAPAVLAGYPTPALDRRMPHARTSVALLFFENALAQDGRAAVGTASSVNLHNVAKILDGSARWLDVLAAETKLSDVSIHCECGRSSLKYLDKETTSMQKREKASLAVGTDMQLLLTVIVQKTH